MLLLPALLLVGCFFVWPVINLAILSLQPPNAALSGVSVTLLNYRTAVGDPVNITTCGRSIAFAIACTGISLVVGYPFSYVLSKVGQLLQVAILLVVAMPLTLNLLAASFAWIVMLQRHGGVNWFLITLHFSPGPVDFLFTAGATLTGMLYVVLPLMILPIFSSLVGIDASYVEAARSLGANQLTAFARITFPLSLPSVAVGMLLVFIASFGLYLVPELLGGPSLTLFPFPIEEQTLVFLNWPLAAALSIMLILVLIPVLILLQRPFWKLAEAVPHE